MPTDITSTRKTDCSAHSERAELDRAVTDNTIASLPHPQSDQELAVGLMKTEEKVKTAKGSFTEKNTAVTNQTVKVNLK